MVRSKLPYENREILPRSETEGTYDDVRALDAFSQRMSSVFQCVHLLPYQTEALFSESNDAEGAVEGQYHLLFEGPGVLRRVWFSVEDPVWRERGKRVVALRIEYDRHLIC